MRIQQIYLNEFIHQTKTFSINFIFLSWVHFELKSIMKCFFKVQYFLRVIIWILFLCGEFSEFFPINQKQRGKNRKLSFDGVLLVSSNIFRFLPNALNEYKTKFSLDYFDHENGNNEKRNWIANWAIFWSERRWFLLGEFNLNINISSRFNVGSLLCSVFIMLNVVLDELNSV